MTEVNLNDTTIMAGGNNDNQVNAHEDRLQRLEEDASELAKHTIQLAHINQQISEGFAQVNDKIEYLVKPLADKLNETTKTLDTSNDRIASLEAVGERRNKFAANFKKGLWLLAAGGLAILGQKLVSYLWVFFT